MNGLLIRPYRDNDTGTLADLFHRAVRDGTARHYSAEQRSAWSPSPPDTPRWTARLSEAQTMVAERDGTAVGFMTLDPRTGFLDFAYVAPEVMGQGVAEILYAVIEGRARVAGLTRLETEASLLAERFFVRRGWHLVRRQEVERNGIRIPNAVMEKVLSQKAIFAA
jgi:putative acetyltransferase